MPRGRQSDVNSPGRGRSRSRSGREGKRGSSSATSVKTMKNMLQPSMEELCAKAIEAEMMPGKTSDRTFWLLAVIQLPILMILSRYFIRDSRFEIIALLSMSGHWFGFIIALLLQSNKWFDVTEDITYLCTFIWVYYSIPGNPTPSQQLVSLCALLWMTRLLGFLAFRIIHRGSDWRFDALSKNNSYNFFGWTCGGSWCYFNGFCLWVLAAHGKKGGVSLMTWIGITIQVIGLAIEIVSDNQKYIFREKNKTGFISTGLWKYSRHPNYLGEVINWFGLAIACTGALEDTTETYVFACRAAMCLISPIWSGFFLFFTSLMLLEKRANERWKKSSSYATYKERTPIFFPVHI